VSGAWIEIRVAVFWVMTPCGHVVLHQRFGRTFTSIFRVKWVGLGQRFVSRSSGYCRRVVMCLIYFWILSISWGINLKVMQRTR